MPMTWLRKTSPPILYDSKSTPSYATQLSLICDCVHFFVGLYVCFLVGLLFPLVINWSPAVSP